jgi:flagellar hook-basal body complex protein FliE
MMLNMLNGPAALTSQGTGAISPGGATAGAAASAAAGAQSPDFGEMMSSLISDTISTLQKSEAVSMAGVQGKASVQQVVESVMQAEQSLTATLAIRDKIVSAYLEISRMPI